MSNYLQSHNHMIIFQITDINMSFEPIKTGRKVTSIKFIIEEKFKNSRKRIRTSNESGFRQKYSGAYFLLGDFGNGKMR